MNARLATSMIGVLIVLAIVVGIVHVITAGMSSVSDHLREQTGQALILSR